MELHGYWRYTFEMGSPSSGTTTQSIQLVCVLQWTSQRKHQNLTESPLQDLKINDILLLLSLTLNYSAKNERTSQFLDEKTW